jgi:hypothetical protein
MKRFSFLTICFLLSFTSMAQQLLKAEDVFAKFGEVYFSFENND